MFPNQVKLGLHIRGFRRDGNHRVFFRKDQDVLAKSPVGPVRIVPAAPHLVAIALQPVARILFPLRCVRVLQNFHRRGLLHPRSRQNLFAFPHALLQE